MLPVATSAQDFGAYIAGDFSGLNRAGSYQLRGQNFSPVDFEVAEKPYASAIAKSVAYFARQRCGDSTTGHHAPCHLDDGVRQDNGRRLDTAGGWHDACDLRKWVDATIYGMIGLADVCDENVGLPREQIVEELRWGETYFRKMQEPAGYLMNYCGGDDGNRYTDNQPGTPDDRVIHVEPAVLTAQFHFIRVEAQLAMLTRDSDPEFAESCMAAALRCLEWCETQTPDTVTHWAAGVIAMCALHRATPEDRFANLATHYLDGLLALQFDAKSDPACRGAFRRARGSDDPSREIHHGNMPPLALCAAIERLNLPDRGKWMESLHLSMSHLSSMASRSAFDIAPFGLYLNPRDAHARPINERFGYRYFMRTENEYSWSRDWWVGINAHLASTGLAMARAATVLKDTSLRGRAQRQLDWILGSNPFSASTISGVGRNQPRLYVTTEFKPPTPIISGGVMNGIGGTVDDAPTLSSGNWNTCEYWTPMVGYTMQLMSELQH